MYVLLPLLPPLVLLAVMGLAWVEEHLLPQPDHLRLPRPCPPPRDTLTADPQNSRGARIPSGAAHGNLPVGSAMRPR